MPRPLVRPQRREVEHLEREEEEIGVVGNPTMKNL